VRGSARSGYERRRAAMRAFVTMLLGLALVGLPPANE
jgi:hypothetical protein